MIINLTGQSGSGKTTIAKGLLNLIPKSINIDGDELRDIFKNKDYSEKGRRNNIINAYNIAMFLEYKGFNPIISLISPYKDLRNDLKVKTNVIEFYIHTTEIRGKEKFFAENYEPPNENFFDVDTTNIEVQDILSDVLLNIYKTK
jgi:adenylylsulfate kinase